MNLFLVLKLPLVIAAFLSFAAGFFEASMYFSLINSMYCLMFMEIEGYELVVVNSFILKDFFKVEFDSMGISILRGSLKQNVKIFSAENDMILLILSTYI